MYRQLAGWALVPRVKGLLAAAMVTSETYEKKFRTNCRIFTSRTYFGPILTQ